MTERGFPVDEYTPHGYLANPYAVAHSWYEGEGGCLRTSREYVGFGWQLPWSLRAQASVDLIVSLEGDGQQLVTRTDFDAAGLVSTHHSSRLFVYRWEALGRTWEAAYTLIDRDVLGLQVSWQATDHADVPEVMLTVGMIGWRQQVGGENGSRAPVLTGHVERYRMDDTGWPYGWIDLGAPLGSCELLFDGTGAKPPDTTFETALRQSLLPDPRVPPAPDEQLSTTLPLALGFRIGSAPSGSMSTIARRVAADSHPNPLPEGAGDGRGARLAPTSPAPDLPPLSAPEMMSAKPIVAPRSGPGGEVSPGRIVAAAVDRAREADDAFWRGATHLEGDWPASWRRGWVYDTETTRMCVYPPGGIFADVWPAWMVQWPRAVVAEGTLDMARFAYASPEIAQRALFSLFRDAGAPNVPCVFQHGEPNMVAKDGSICGTSPAWCVPFYNLERLFSQTLDREWLAAIYPYLARYLEWWLAERTDPESWAVYKCTWEAGEDDTPRLDPERRGDNVVSAFVRPVELQATMALSAGVMERFATVLGDTVGQLRWRQVKADYLDRTRQLWDPAERRFRDWDARNGRFVAPAPDQPNYWGIDPCRYSALAFTPLLAGLLDDEFRAGLRNELRQYDGPPWTLWASWSYVVLEAAPRTGDHSFAGRVAAEIVGRVYDELDARQIADPRHPTPGVAREYWPLDLDTWASCEGYGWGANTASLLVRQVFGFTEGPYLDATTPLTFELRPALPSSLLVPGREYWLTNLPYRGARLSLGYRVADAQPDEAGSFSVLEILVSADVLTRCQVVDTTAPLAWESGDPGSLHKIPARIGGEYVVELYADS